MYDILNKLKSVSATAPATDNTLTESTVTVEKTGLAKQIAKLEEQYSRISEAREFSSKAEFDDKAQPGDWCNTANGKLIKTEKGVRHERGASKDTEELDEAAKPDFLDLDKDGDKTEPMKKASKEKKPDYKKSFQDQFGGSAADLTKNLKVKEGREFKSKDEFDDNAQPGDWYKSAQGKVIKTEKGVKHERSASKDEDQLDELSPGTLSSYAAQARGQGQWAAGVASPGGGVSDRDSAAYAKLANKRLAGAKQAEKKAGMAPGEAGSASYDWQRKGGYGDKNSPARKHGALNEYSDEEYNAAMRDFKARGGKAQQLPTGKAKNPISTASRHIGGRGEVGKGKPSGRDAKVDPAGKAVVDVYEKAPPGANAERMVKHIKKGYADDGALTKREKGIAYATAWKAHNKGQVEEGVEFGDTIKNSKAELKKAKKVKMTEGVIRNHPIYTTQEAWDHYAKELAEQEAMEGMGDHMHEPGIPAPTAAQPVTSAVDAELAEIARLAGLPARTDDIEWPEEHTDRYDNDDDDDFPLPPPHEDPIVLETEDLEEEEMEEGNEFSGALAKAKAAGAKEFEVDGKKYTVKEDVNLTADTVDDVVGLIRKLAGLDSVAPAEPQPTATMPSDMEFTAVADDDMVEERDIEYVNTPQEKVAPLAAATPNGNDLHRAKRSYSDKPFRGDNPMAVQETVEDTLWKKYSGMLKGLLK